MERWGKVEDSASPELFVFVFSIDVGRMKKAEWVLKKGYKYCDTVPTLFWFFPLSVPLSELLCVREAGVCARVRACVFVCVMFLWAAVVTKKVFKKHWLVKGWSMVWKTNVTTNTWRGARAWGMRHVQVATHVQGRQETKPAHTQTVMLLGEQRKGWNDLEW